MNISTEKPEANPTTSELSSSLFARYIDGVVSVDLWFVELWKGPLEKNQRKIRVEFPADHILIDYKAGVYMHWKKLVKFILWNFQLYH
jgi:hypothetical protein